MKKIDVRSLMKRYRFALIVISLVIILNYPWFYFGPGPSGTVVDEHGKPVEGVVAVFGFGTSGHRLFHGTTSTSIKGMEAVTDSNGNYKFPFWVTKKRPLLELAASGNPGIDFYKSGYKKTHSVYNKDWRGLKKLFMYVDFNPSKEITMLTKYKNIEDEKRDWLLVRWGIRAMHSNRCGWKMFPNFIIEQQKVVDRLREISEKKDYRRIGSTIRFAENSERWCGSPKDFFDKLESQK